MVNPRLIEFAKRHMNKEPPAKRPDKGLTQILERDEDGKPIIKLEPIENTVVNTRTQDDYWTLMRVYECGGFRWMDNGTPFHKNKWPDHNEKTCISAGASTLGKTDSRFGYERESYCRDIGWNIISPSEFYKNQKVTKKMINEINKYFDNK